MLRPGHLYESLTMPQAPASGPIDVRGDLTAHTVNTGYIEKNTQLTLNVIVTSLEHLAAVLAQPDVAMRLSAHGGWEAAAGTQGALALSDNLLKAWHLLPQAVDASPEIRRRAYAAWLVTQQPIAPPQEIAARQQYVPLAGWMSLQDLPLMTLQFTAQRWVGTGPQRQLERIPLTDVTEAIAQHPAFVLLGPPGCGKSTVLRRLALDIARAVLVGHDTRLPFRVNLASYAWPHTHASPLDFLTQQWQETGLPGDVVSQVRAGEVVLLADGLNEMPRLTSASEQQQRANAWQQCIETYFSDPHNHSRAVFASRDQADYAQPLGLPRVEIEPLRDEQIAAFLQAYVGDEAAEALDAISRLDLLAHARNPYQLSVLAALYQAQGGDLPANRGQLFAAYARELLKREERVNHAHWMPIAVQLAALSHLGYAMQEHSESTSVSHERVLALLPHTVIVEHNAVALSSADVLDLACRAGLLIPESPASPATTYKFSHQLLQEHFAARHLLAQWQAGTPQAGIWWHSPRTQQDMPAATGGEWDPLPPPPPTGWEQVTILAAGMTDQADAFVQAVAAANPALAGRCLSEGSALVSSAAREAVQRVLLADLGNPHLHRRARLAAGRVLGAVGDPRLTPQVIHSVQVILPDLVSVPGGTATIGSARWPWDRQAYDNERPRHPVPVAASYLARFPVTNAEYACFMQAGGYDTERYWMPAGWQWRHGQGENSGPVEELLDIWRLYRRNPSLITQSLKAGQMTPDNADAWGQLVKLAEEEARQRISEMYPMQPREQPYFWHDPAYNASNLPVVGVTWYEAMAYCAWLHEQATASQSILPVAEVSWATLLGSGRWQVRLPTEAEWEWAAGGPQQRRYPWGKTLAVEHANTLEGRVMGTSPVGAYPAGAAACGALDMSGNVWEWTHSLYQPYPYRQQDGREDGLAESRRVLRGGAWDGSARDARVSYRDRAHPANFSYFAGVRVVVAPVL